MNKIVVYSFIFISLNIFSLNLLSDTQIPIEIQERNVVIQLEIKGKILRVLVDSGGSSGLSLRKEIVDELDIQPLNSLVESENIYGKKNTSSKIIIPNIKIHKKTYSNILGKTWNVPKQLDKLQPQIDGVIGRQFLNQYNVIYDFSKHEIRLLNISSELSSECKGIRKKIVYVEEGALTSQIYVKEGAMSVLWDTGASYSFIKQFFATKNKLNLVDQIYHTLLMNGQKESGVMLQFISIDFSKPDAVDAIIGHDFFLKHKVCIDQSKKEIIFSKSKE